MIQHLKNITRLWDIIKPFHKYFYIQLGLIILLQGLIVAAAYSQSSILNLLVEKNTHLLVYAFIAYACILALDDYIEYLSVKNSQNNLDQMLFQFIQEFSYKKYFPLHLLNTLKIIQLSN